jgi:signal peptidase I
MPLENQSSTSNNYYLEPQKESAVKEAIKKSSKTFLNILQGVIAIAVVFMLTYLFVLPISIVDGPSMEPNFCDKDIYLTYKFETFFNLYPYERGDVIAFKESSNTNLIKRIVGLPGESIRFEGGDVYINGELLHESYLQDDVFTSNGIFQQALEGQTYFIPTDKYFALGDNRPFSLDSRDIGPIHPVDNEINGKVVAIIWPPQRMRIFDNAQGFEAGECRG